VRRQLQHEGAELKGSLWSLRGNAWNLSGFENFVHFRTAAYLRAGRLKFELRVIN
jgi:hypothetical protein